jgi:PAS domain S-box-containing protein
LPESPLSTAPDRQLAADSLHLLVESVRDYAIFMLDPDGIVRTWNRGAARLKGYGAAEIIGRHFSVFYPTRDREMGRPEKNLATALAEGRFEDEGWRVRKDGTEFWADVVITAIHDPNGRLRGFAKVTRDLTERRRAEEQSILLAHAEEAVRLREEFMSIAAHELRTPLHALQLQITALNLLLERSSENIDRAALGERSRRAVHLTKRLGALITRLLDSSRIAAGRLTLQKEPTDLVRCTTGVLDTLRERIAVSGMEIQLVAPDELVGNWDPLRIEQVMYNLIENAITYGRPPLDISIGADEATATIDVRDHGGGIAEDEAPKIFAKPLRGRPREGGGGLGLGLYISRAIVEEHGGRIVLVDSSGGGAHFRIMLPRESAAGACAQETMTWRGQPTSTS